MQTKGNKEKGCFPASLSAGLLQTAVGAPWPTVLVTGLAAMFLRRLPRAEESPRWLRFAQALWSIFVMAQAMAWSRNCWPAAPTGFWIPPILLLAALWISNKGRKAAETTANVLGILELGLLAAVLLAGLGEIRLENLRPRWQMPDGWLIAVLLLPGLTRGDGKGWPWAVLYSAVTAGVLGASRENTFFEMSRSVSLLGSVKRMESLAAMALTIGFALLLCSLLADMDRGRETLICCAGAFGIYAWGIPVPGVAAAVASILLWTLLPAWSQRNTKKREQNNEKDAQ